jgi:hypothetical protein
MMEFEELIHEYEAIPDGADKNCSVTLLWNLSINTED